MAKDGVVDLERALQVGHPGPVELEQGDHVVAVAETGDLVGEPPLAPHGRLADRAPQAADQGVHRLGGGPERLVVEFGPDDVHELVVAHHARTSFPMG